MNREDPDSSEDHGVFQIPPSDHRRGVNDRPGHRLPPHRHRRRCTRTRRASATASARPASTAPRCSSPASSTTGSTNPTTRVAAFDETLSALGFDYVDLFLIHWPLPTLYDGDYVSTLKTLEEFRPRTAGPAASACRTSRSAHLSSGSPTDRHGARGEPDRGAPVLRQHEVRAYAGARHRSPRRGHRSPQGKVLDDPVIDRVSPKTHGKSAAPGRCCAGTSSAATSCSRSRCTGAHQGATSRSVRLRAGRRRRRRHHRRSTRASRAQRPQPDTFDYQHHRDELAESTTTEALRGRETGWSQAAARSRVVRLPALRASRAPWRSRSDGARPHRRDRRIQATPVSRAPGRRTSARCASRARRRRCRVRYWSGSDSLAIVRHVLPYCTRNDPVV